MESESKGAEVTCRFSSFWLAITLLSSSIGAPESLAAVEPKGGSIAISSPAPSSRVRQGETVHVVVKPSAGVSLVSLAVFGPGSVVRIRAAPWEVDLPVAAEQLGTFAIQASAKTSKGTVLFSRKVSLEAVSAASLELSPVPANVPDVGAAGIPIFEDGFESSNTSRWSEQVP